MSQVICLNRPGVLYNYYGWYVVRVAPKLNYNDCLRRPMTFYKLLRRVLNKYEYVRKRANYYDPVLILHSLKSRLNCLSVNSKKSAVIALLTTLKKIMVAYNIYIYIYRLVVKANYSVLANHKMRSF